MVMLIMSSKALWTAFSRMIKKYVMEIFGA